jgi:phospholipid-translocating ATPase
LFQNIVPISLYISIEIVKTIQAFFIAQDLDMYYAPFDTACVPKTWNISDDLGQIEYVFSDKTGTLTQNVMEFQKCSVGGVQYGEGITEAQRGAAQREGRAGELMSPDEQREHLAGLKDAMLAKMARAFKNRYLRADHLTLIDPKLADDLADRGAPQRAQLLAFFRALALCHSVLAAHPDPDQPFVTEYKAESPDEAALVAAARDVGVPFVGRTKHALDIEVLGQPERHAPLRMIEFTSTRKRMSVLARGPDGRITLYCKGADSVIYQRLAPDHDQALKDATARDMEAFANGGLRTLCIASRAISEDEYLRWSRTADAAAAATKDRDAEIDKANELIEHSLTILGATALEDKLQEGVPEAIEQLHQAGIKLWILTGAQSHCSPVCCVLTARARRQAADGDRDRVQLQPAQERDGHHDHLRGHARRRARDDRGRAEQDRERARPAVAEPERARVLAEREGEFRRRHRRRHAPLRARRRAQAALPRARHAVRDRRLLPRQPRAEGAHR